MERRILYIHGFGSSGHSHKARILKQHFPRVHAPTVSTIPALAVETLEEFIGAMADAPVLVGSSLGGFYALHLSQKHGLPAVLVNPALLSNVRNTPPFHRLIGMNKSYFDGSAFEFTPAHLGFLQHLSTTVSRPELLLLLVQVGDEVLDHRATRRALPEVRTVAEEGGSHAFDGFDRHMATIREFAAAFVHP